MQFVMAITVNSRMIFCLFLALVQILAIRSEISSFQNDYDPENRASLTEHDPGVELPASSEGLRRRKRDWEIPDIAISENGKGPFPKFVVKIQSSFSKEVQVTYSITGEGADLDPKGLFTIDRTGGALYVTKPLDREVKSSYKLQAHAVLIDGARKESLDIIINVIDMNDNKPVFTQDPFLGCVPESLPIDFEFMRITATDADDAKNTDHAEIRYSIVSQDPPLPNPNMFTINPVTGGIRVNSAGLDKENYPEYTLEIEASDMAGSGLKSSGKAVISLKDCSWQKPISICNVEPQHAVLSIGDKDGINAEIIGVSKDIWKANHDAIDGQQASGKPDSGHFIIVLKVSDRASLYKNSATIVQTKEACMKAGDVLL